MIQWEYLKAETQWLAWRVSIRVMSFVVLPFSSYVWLLTCYIPFCCVEVYCRIKSNYIVKGVSFCYSWCWLLSDLLIFYYKLIYSFLYIALKLSNLSKGNFPILIFFGMKLEINLWLSKLKYFSKNFSWRIVHIHIIGIRIIEIDHGQWKV